MTTYNATYNQDGQASPLILGHSYAWEVTSYGYVDSIEVAISQSEYWEFTYGTVTGSVHNLTKDSYYNTIQAALNDAGNDNTIEVADGTYDESITFPSGKKIILQSINGASSTIIRGDDGLATVTLEDTTISGSLKGFTITHTHAIGDYGDGRGIYIIGGNLSIENCNITGNHVRQIHNGYGGGIYNANDGILIINESNISDNYASGGGGYTYANGTGGGIKNFGILIINRSTISNNYASGEGGAAGGGIASYGGTLTITESTISDNYVQCSYGASGGGIASDDFIITASIISDNYGSDDGGIYLGSSGTFTIGGSNDADKNTICGNYKTGEDPSLDQQIRDDTGSLYETYKDTNHISAYCE